MEIRNIPPPLAGLDVLLLEDNMIIAMDAEYMLRELGAANVTVAATIPAAEAEVDTRRFDFAMLDINLGSRTSFDFAAQLKRDRVPYIFASGYGDQMPLSATQRLAVVVQKPYQLEHLAVAVLQTIGKVQPETEAGANSEEQL